MFEFISNYPLLSILLFVGAIIGISAWKQMHPDPQWFCLRCGKTAAPATKDAGSGCIELILWLCFIIPGLIYSVWRRNAAKKTCCFCGSTELVPLDSPRAISALSVPPVAFDVTIVETTKRCPQCAETILAAAVKCKHCGSAV